MIRRSRAREVALQLLFQRDFNPKLPRQTLIQFAQDRLHETELRVFCVTLYDGTVSHLEEIDARLASRRRELAPAPHGHRRSQRPPPGRLRASVLERTRRPPSPSTRRSSWRGASARPTLPRSSTACSTGCAARNPPPGCPQTDTGPICLPALPSPACASTEPAPCEGPRRPAPAHHLQRRHLHAGPGRRPGPTQRSGRHRRHRPRHPRRRRARPRRRARSWRSSPASRSPASSRAASFTCSATSSIPDDVPLRAALAGDSCRDVRTASRPWSSAWVSAALHPRCVGGQPSSRPPPWAGVTWRSCWSRAGTADSVREAFSAIPGRPRSGAGGEAAAAGRARHRAGPWRRRRCGLGASSL